MVSGCSNRTEHSERRKMDKTSESERLSLCDVKEVGGTPTSRKLVALWTSSTITGSSPRSYIEAQADLVDPKTTS